MTVLPIRRRTAAALAVSALLLAGVSACGSSDATADDPGTAASDTAASGAASTAAAEATDSPTAATDTSESAGVAPASITIDSPDDGTEVGDTLTVQGMANSPEANVPWEVDSLIDGVVVSGSTTAEGWLDKAYPWKAEVNVSALQPGTYTFTARVDDDSDKEGARPPEATITFTKN